MPNETHLELLRAGSAVWNAWRNEHRQVVPDLSGARLRELDLRGFALWGTNFTQTSLVDVDLRGADLRQAELGGAYLYKAALADADLERARLSGAELRSVTMPGAKLRHAELVGAVLAGADMFSADLSHANLYGANLNHTKLSRATLREAVFSNAKLHKADLSHVDCSEAPVRGFAGRTLMIDAELVGANLRHANLRGVDFTTANLWGADLTDADLRDTDMGGARLGGACLESADLTGANLMRAELINTRLSGADMTGCKIYGISAWDLQLDATTIQVDLVITPPDQNLITVDRLEVAQFVYLMLSSEKIRDVLTTIGDKGVLLLGRFSPERKAVLDALRTRLRELNFVPMMFDFEKADDRSFTETIKILAGLSRFIIADVTNPKSAPLELQATVPDYMVPFVPIIQHGEAPFSMIADLQAYEWVMPVKEYRSIEQLLTSLEAKIIDPACRLQRELQLKKARQVQVESLD